MTNDLLHGQKPQKSIHGLKMSNRLTKQPTESILMNMTFPAPPFRSTESIASVSSLTVSTIGNVTEVTPLTVTTNNFSSNILQLLVSGGTDREDYKVTAVVVTDGTPAQTLEMEGLLYVGDD